MPESEARQNALHPGVAIRDDLPAQMHPRQDLHQPIEIAPSVWWVGMRLPDDRFQCHSYFIHCGDNSALIDPGSALTIETTLKKLRQITELDQIRYLVCHHPDPDIAGSLGFLSQHLPRPDVLVVTEWRAKALLRHYGHRFAYYRVEENDWRLPLQEGRRLEFQLTPYLHFPGALVSFDTATATLFSSDLFGGFVPDNAVLEAPDVATIIDNARPFHQHYMPSRELLTAGLTRIQLRWPEIQRIAPQHGHIVPGPLVSAAFEGLKEIECGVFSLADADIDLRRLLRISEARRSLTEALVKRSTPLSLLHALRATLLEMGEAEDCELGIDLPGQGWSTWTAEAAEPQPRLPHPDWYHLCLPGKPALVLALQGKTRDNVLHSDVERMLRHFAESMRPWVETMLESRRQSRRADEFRSAAFLDPLTGLGNRRALDAFRLSGSYALIAMDLDHFKAVNDQFGHLAGDEVLKAVARVLRQSLRQNDAVMRLGGEEFLLVLPAADQDTALRIAERIRQSVKELDLRGLAPGGRITMSLGVSLRIGPARPQRAGHSGGEERNQDDFAAALARADRALYRSKENGRDRVSFAGSTPSGDAIAEG